MMRERISRRELYRRCLRIGEIGGGRGGAGGVRGRGAELAPLRRDHERPAPGESWTSAVRDAAEQHQLAADNCPLLPIGHGGRPPLRTPGRGAWRQTLAPPSSAALPPTPPPPISAASSFAVASALHALLRVHLADHREWARSP